ncbi:hypothetical protein, partial [Pseudomonas fluorescens]|uniref:hypothetical protein n=1 Tax=Pseudomonas fluorescens TaxID=294 RepID=UPI001A9206FD
MFGKPNAQEGIPSRAFVGAGLPVMVIGIYTNIGVWGEYISVAAVMASIGSALTAGHFWQTPQ